MQRCGIERGDGVIRLGILCADCADLALTRLIREQRRFWTREYLGPEICEACHADDRLMIGES